MAFVTYVWTRERREIADALIIEGCTAEYIAYRVGVTVYQAKTYINNRSQRVLRNRPRPGQPSPQAIEERDARLLAPRDLTAQLFGDPPPGYSALDRKRAGVS